MPEHNTMIFIWYLNLKTKLQEPNFHKYKDHNFIIPTKQGNLKAYQIKRTLPVC